MSGMRKRWEEEDDEMEARGGKIETGKGRRRR